jgi:hypothetical protein
MSTPTIAERVNPRTGRREFRAYPNGTDSPDGGSGPWTPDHDAAGFNLVAALLDQAMEARR